MSEKNSLMVELTEKKKKSFEKDLEKLLKKFGIKKCQFDKDIATQENRDSQVNNGIVLGNMVFNIPFEDLKFYFEEEFKGLKASFKAVKPLVLDAIKIFFQEYHDGLMDMRKLSELKLDSIKNGQKDLINELQMFCDQGRKGDELLKEKQEQFEREIT